MTIHHASGRRDVQLNSWRQPPLVTKVAVFGVGGNASNPATFKNLADVGASDNHWALQNADSNKWGPLSSAWMPRPDSNDLVAAAIAHYALTSVIAQENNWARQNVLQQVQQPAPIQFTVS